VIVRLINPGEIFGAAGGWGEDRYPASARAQEDSVVLHLPAAEFEHLLATEPALP
jgi:CRP-like cAMP-binding protein